MKNIAKKSLKNTLLMGAMALVLSSTPVLAKDVVATVNGTEITKAEVETFYQNSPAKMQGIPLDTIQAAIVDQLISMHLMDEKIADSGLSKDKAVQQRIDQAKTQILRDAWLKQQIDGKMNDKALKDLYKKHISELKDEKEIKARHILVDTEEEAKAIIKSLDDGAKFEELAKEKSIGPSGATGGDLGYFTKGAMVPEFSKAAFAMKEDEYSKTPVQTQFGYHVILVEDKRNIEPPKFEDLEPRLRAELSRETLTKVIDDLQASATIERFDEKESDKN